MRKTLMLASVVYMLRWAIQWLIPVPGVMIGVQTLHGMSFGFFYIAAVEYVASITGKELQATGQSLFNMVFVGLGGIAGNLLNGYLLDSGGPRLMYFSCTVSAALGALLLYKVSSISHKKQQSE
ncbi:MFS transporter [Paenibacillus rhizoplanae]